MKERVLRRFEQFVADVLPTRSGRDRVAFGAKALGQDLRWAWSPTF
jgi:hypothetical protein